MYYNTDDYKSVRIKVVDTLRELLQKVQNFCIKAENFISTDGTPYTVKVARTVWRSVKS